MGGATGFALWFGFSVGLIVVDFGSLCGLGVGGCVDLWVGVGFWC